MDSKQDGPTAATTSSWILSWHCHEQHTCSWQAAHREAPHPPQTTVPSAPCCGRSSSRAHTCPRKHICHSKSVFPQDILLYHNNLLTFPGLPHIVQALLCRLQKKPSTFPFQILISPSAKIPHENVAFIVAVYFYLALLYSTNCCPLPMPPVLTSGQRFL